MPRKSSSKTVAPMEAVVELPPEIMAMMAAAEATATGEPESSDTALPDAAGTMEFPESEAFVLPSVLDITAAKPLHEALLERRGRSLAVDASEVKRLGGQCLQLLLSAGLTWRADGQIITLTGASEAFERDLKLFGIESAELFHREVL